MTATAVVAAELLQIIEAYEAFELEKKGVGESQKDLMADAKGRGFDTKILKRVIALRARSTAQVQEEEALLELYKSALGME